jgi:uncharacterized protein YegJ (DUF2314 family)
MSKQNEASPFELEVVLLQEGWWDLSGEILQDIARRAFRKTLRVSDVDDDKKKKKPTGEDNDWIVAGFPMFSVNYRGVLFMIFTIPEPFFEDREAAAESASELRLAKAIREHDTHITVKMMNNGSDLDEEGRQRLFGRFLAYFTWYPHTRAILWPARGLGRPWDKKLRKALRDLPVTKALLHVPGKEEPVSRVTPSDEDIQQATEEARRRWPEFLAAYNHRIEGQEFFVKAPFKDGEHVEHMWTQVAALEEEFVVARVMNDPVDLKKFKKGTKVRFRNTILSDWFYGTKGGEVVGLFVENVLHRKHAEDVERRLDTEAEDDLDADDFDDDEDTGPPPAAAAERVQALPPAQAVRPAPREPVRPERRAAEREEHAGMGLARFVLGGFSLLALLVLGIVVFLIVRALRTDEVPPPGPVAGGPAPPIKGGPGPVVKEEGPKRQGGNSGGHIMRNFVEALDRKDLRAAYDSTSTAFQQRQPFADFERAVRESKVLEGPRPFSVNWRGRDAQGREAAEIRFDRVPLTVPPLVKATYRSDPDGTGWWIENLEWQPGAGEQALAYLKTKENEKKEKSAKKEGSPTSPFGAAKQFVELLEQRDLAGAYALTTEAYQSRVARPQFDAAVAGNAALQKKVKLGVYAGGSGFTIPYTVRPADQPPQTPPAFVVRVRQENGQWRVEEIEWRKP